MALQHQHLPVATCRKLVSKPERKEKKKRKEEKKRKKKKLREESSLLFTPGLRIERRKKRKKTPPSLQLCFDLAVGLLGRRRLLVHSDVPALVRTVAEEDHLDR